MRDELGSPQVADRSTFQAELDGLRVRERAYTREGAAIVAVRRRLPIVDVDGATSLAGDCGAVKRYSKRRQCDDLYNFPRQQF